MPSRKDFARGFGSFAAHGLAFGPSRVQKPPMPENQPLLLLPGLLCDARLWAAQAEALADIARPVIADLTGQDSLPAMAEAVLATAPARFALAGLSMGGYLALEIMRRAPGRVSRLALFDTSARADTPEQARRRRGLIALTRSGKFKGVTPRLLPQLVHPRHQEGAVGRVVMEMAAEVGREAFLRQMSAILARPDSRPDLPGLHLPTLVAVGAEDLTTPPELAEEIAALIPGARLARLPDCGHLPPLEDPAATTALLRAWLAA